MKRVYIAGPISKGDHAINIRNGILAAEKLAQAGFAPYCPHWTFFWHFLVPHEDIDFWYRLDNEWLLCCHAVLRLPGESKGADKEVELAIREGIPVYYRVADIPKE